MAGKRKAIKRDSLGRRTDRVKKPERDKMVRLKELGLRINDIAAQLNRKSETVRNNLFIAEKISQQIAIQGAFNKLVPEIDKLAKRLERLTNVPLATTPFLSENKEDETRIVNNFITSNSHLFISALMAQPWWCATGSIDLRRYLSARDEALLDLVLNLPVSSKLKSLLEEWQQKTNTYLSLEQSNTDTDAMNRAHDQAEQITSMLHAELWKVVVNLSTKPTQ